MNTLIFGYRVFNKDRKLVPKSPNIQVDFSVKLVILNPSLTSTGVVDSSSTFYTTKLSMGNGFPVKEEALEENKVINKEVRPDAIIGGSTITLGLCSSINGPRDSVNINFFIILLMYIRNR